MVNVAQLVEHQIVALVAVGSIPTIHPKKYYKNQLQRGKKLATLVIDLAFVKKIVSGCGAIGSALALGARGCQFESGRPDHFFNQTLEPQYFLASSSIFSNLV